MLKKQINLLIILSFLLFVLLDTCVFGCETPSSGYDFLKTIPQKDRITFQSDEVVIVNLYFHIIRKADGTGGQTLAEVEEAFNLLQSDFRPHNICFNLLGIGEIFNDDYYDGLPRYARKDGKNYFQKIAKKSKVCKKPDTFSKNSKKKMIF